MEQPLTKSSPGNRRQAILDALELAHEDARRWCGSSLNRMPEYFMAIRVADYFAKTFLNFGYRLEPQVKRTFQDAHLWHEEAESLHVDPDIRPNGRFDLVLYNVKRDRPAHVIEFKRGSKLESLRTDVKRLASVCYHAGVKSLETNYLVLTRKCPARMPIEKVKKALCEELNGIGNINCSIHCSEPLSPMYSREQEVLEGATFRIWLIEVRAA